MDNNIFTGLQFDCDSGMESLKIVKYIGGWGGGGWKVLLLFIGVWLISSS